MITLYSGTPGSGKSLHCARTIINWSRLGCPVIGNFTVDLSKYKRADYTYCPNHEMTPDYFIKFKLDRYGEKHIPEGSMLIVIDECQLLFNARDWQQTGRNKWLSFFTQHRKFGYDIILIAQFDRMVDRYIRSLIEYEYIHRKMSNFGWQGKMLSLVFGGKTFIAVKRWYPLKEKVGSEIFHARKKLYSIYDSYATFDTKPAPAPIAAPSKPDPEEAPSPAPLPDPPEPEVLEAEIIQDTPKKRSRFLTGSYIRPWEKRSLVSTNGKFLRPGGRSETGWTNRPAS